MSRTGTRRGGRREGFAIHVSRWVTRTNADGDGNRDWRDMTCTKIVKRMMNIVHDTMALRCCEGKTMASAKAIAPRSPACHITTCGRRSGGRFALHCGVASPCCTATTPAPDLMLCLDSIAAAAHVEEGGEDDHHHASQQRADQHRDDAEGLPARASTRHARDAVAAALITTGERGIWGMGRRRAEAPRGNAHVHEPRGTCRSHRRR